MRTTILTVLLITVIAPVAHAQPACQLEETIQRCWTRIESETDENAVEERAEEEAEEDLLTETRSKLAAKPTGLGPGVEGLSSAIEDFLPLVRFALAATGTESLEGEVQDIEYKLPLGAASPIELKVRAAFNDLEVFAPLAAHIPEEQRETLVGALKDGLEHGDDVTISLLGNRASEKLGRTLRQETFAGLFDALVAEHAGRFPEPAFDAFIQDPEVASAFRDPSRFEEGADLQMPLGIRFEQIRDEEFRLRLMARVAELARETRLGTESLRALAEEEGLFRLAELKDNQPQLNGSLQYRTRRAAAGPDQWDAELTYERGWANLNAFGDECGGKQGRDLLDCYRTFLATNEGAIETGNRLTFTAKYSDRKVFHFARPEDLATDFDLERGTSLTLSLTYGRSAGAGLFGAGEARLDVDGSYEEVDDDPARQDRGVVTFTYTDRMFKALGVSVAVSYANHAKFLPESDEELSAHFGLTLKAFGEKKD